MISFEDFKKGRERRLKIRYERYCWIDKKERGYGLKDIKINNNALMLYHSCELKKEIMDYRDIIRHETAHPKTPVHFSNLGLRYNKDWSWGGKDQEPIIPGSEPCARKGIDLFLRIVKHLLDTNAGKKVKR